MEHKWMSILLPLLLLYNGRCAFIPGLSPLEWRAGRHPRGGLVCPPKWGVVRRGMPQRHRQQRPQRVKDAGRIRKVLELSQTSDWNSDGLQTQPPWDLAEGCEPCRLLLFPCPELHLGIPGRREAGADGAL